MKSYFLEKLTNRGSARAALSEVLPYWIEPWLLKDESDDVVAYLNVVSSSEGNVSIQADLSGRHHSEADLVIQVLRSLKDRLGGLITDDDDNAFG